MLILSNTFTTVLVSMGFVVVVSSGSSDTFSSGLPNKDGTWVSLSHTSSFQPAETSSPALRQAQRRFLDEEVVETTYLEGMNQLFVESANTYYSGYQQAWRYLGFYVDCSPYHDDHRRGRSLNEDEVSACQRYLLWAAYVDLEYEGGGIGEYQFFDTTTGQWDKSACEARSTSRCAKMDCHEPDTHFQLMGFFKEEEYSDWFEQLFKHLGYCVWKDEDTYEFMYENYDMWPDECSETDSVLEDGTPVYYELKPTSDGNMTIGLYTDARCAQEYDGELLTVESVLGDDGDDDSLTSELIDEWNEAMSIYKVCQPCRAYNLQAEQNNNRRRLEDEDPNDGYFQCDDAAGYTDVNQCMKFRTQTEMEVATVQEVITASQQGSLLPTSIQGTLYGSGNNFSPQQLVRRTSQRAFDRRLLQSSIAVLCGGVITLLAAAAYVAKAHSAHFSNFGSALRANLLRK